VATEIRKLAEKSKVAADEITALAVKSVNVTDEAGKLLIDIIPGIEKTTQLVQEITAASLEQNTGAKQINASIQQLNQITQQNASSSEEMTANSENLFSQANALKNIMSFFKIKKERKQNELSLKKILYNQNGKARNGKKYEFNNNTANPGNNGFKINGRKS